MKKIYKKLEPFNYEPSPDDGVDVEMREIMSFKNGRLYEGEWDFNNT